MVLTGLYILTPAFHLESSQAKGIPLKFFSATTASIISSLQPIFGICIAFFLVREIPSLNTYIGGGLIILTVLIESIRSKIEQQSLLPVFPSAMPFTKNLPFLKQLFITNIDVISFYKS